MLGVAALAAAAATVCATADQETVMHVYGAYASADTLFVRGRLLEGRAEDTGALQPPDNSGTWSKVRRTAAAFTSDEVPASKVTLVRRRGEGQAPLTLSSTMTDAEGLFFFAYIHQRADSSAGGLRQLALIFAGDEKRLPVEVGILPQLVGPLAVISDIDDTVLDTGVADRGRMLLNVLTQSAFDLKEVPCAAQLLAFATDLPVFYVSGSPQNLFPRLHLFMRRVGLPRGPVFLKDLGSDGLLVQESYKIERIETLMRQLPATTFIFLGDSGQRDPEVYRSLRRSYPLRVKATMVRSLKSAGEERGGRQVGDFPQTTWVGDYCLDPRALEKLSGAPVTGR